MLFTKPWPDLPVEDLAPFVAEMGFDGVELPVRRKYPVNPDNVLTALPGAARVFRRHGLFIGSVAGSLDGNIIEGMGQAGIPILRILPEIDINQGYLRSVAGWQEAIIEYKPLLEKHQVRVGFQNHNGNYVGSAIGLHHLLAGVPESIAGGVLDLAHCGLVGEPADIAIDIIKERLVLLNFKNGYRHRISNPQGEGEARWQVVWTTAGKGLVSWKSAITDFLALNLDVDICLHAEYNRIGTDSPLFGDDILPFVEADLAYLRNLIGEKVPGTP